MPDEPCSCQTSTHAHASTSTAVLDPPAVTAPDVPALIASAGRYLRNPANRARLTGPIIADASSPDTWHAYLCVEGLQTTDQRAIQTDALSWRDLPLPLRATFEDEGGHWGAVLVGAIDTIERVEVNGMTLLYAEGRFDLAGVNGAEAARLCDAQFLRWLSIDLEIIASEWIAPLGGDPYDDLYWLYYDSENRDPMAQPAATVTADVGDGYELITEGRVAGATMVDIPAFPQAVICPMGMALPVVEPMGEAPDVLPGMVASSDTRYPVKPPSAWFPREAFLTELTPLTVTPEGRVFGHLAPWGACHVGYPGQCVTAPRGEDYRFFLLGQVETADGTMVATGHLTLAGGHADATMGWRPAAQHYDDTDTCFADVTIGEDDIGPWVSGALRPTVSDVVLRTALASPLSGDWRPIEGRLRLIAACCVNAPGFPLVASASRAGIVGGKVSSLIASNPRRHDPLRHMAKRITDLERVVELLAPLAKDALAVRVSA